MSLRAFFSSFFGRNVVFWRLKELGHVVYCVWKLLFLCGGRHRTVKNPKAQLQTANAGQTCFILSRRGSKPGKQTKKMNLTRQGAGEDCLGNQAGRIRQDTWNAWRNAKTQSGCDLLEVNQYTTEGNQGNEQQVSYWEEQVRWWNRRERGYQRAGGRGWVWNDKTGCFLTYSW